MNAVVLTVAWEGFTLSNFLKCVCNLDLLGLCY